MSKGLRKAKIKGWSGTHSPVSPAALRAGLNKAGKKKHSIKNPI